MPKSAIPDLITVVGTSYFQPIADLVENLLREKTPAPNAAGTSSRENGYSVSLVVLLIATLESFVSRLKFLRNDEVISGKSVPDLLVDLFPDLPNKNDLDEVFLLRNIVVHNHIWHLDISNVESTGAPILATPKELKFQTNKSYDSIIDVDAKRTRILKLNASPTAVNREDVGHVFKVVWETLLFMNGKNFGHIPLAGQMIWFKGKKAQFGELPALFLSDS
jgi:hypothetical protein